MKERNAPYSLIPQYDKECTELFFYFPLRTIYKIKFNNYFPLNNGIPTINYKSIHFVMDCKELMKRKCKVQH